jgi:hypothetical protein
MAIRVRRRPTHPGAPGEAAGAVPDVHSRPRPAATLALVALIGVIGAGCSNGAAETGSTASTASTGSAGTDQQTGDRDQGVKFAECVRENGVRDFPDPDASGDYNYGVSVSPQVWTKAVEACKDLQPPGTLSSQRTPEQQQQGLEFARCMRENGVPDFPDPVDGEPLINTYKIPSSNKDGGMTILNAAIKKCGDRLSEAVAGR